MTAGSLIFLWLLGTSLGRSFTKKYRWPLRRRAEGERPSRPVGLVVLLSILAVAGLAVAVLGVVRLA
jgi:hypothetical protein